MRNDGGRNESEVHIRARRQVLLLLLSKLQEHLRQRSSQVRSSEVSRSQAMAQPGSGTASSATHSAYVSPTAPFVLSLIAGLLMLAGAGMAMMMFSYGTSYYGFMGGYYGMMGGFGYGGWFYWAAAVGLIAGVAVLAGAVMI